MSERKVNVSHTPTVLVKVRPGRTYSKNGRLFYPGELLRIPRASVDAAVREGDVEKAVHSLHARDDAKRVW